MGIFAKLFKSGPEALLTDAMSKGQQVMSIEYVAPYTGETTRYQLSGSPHRDNAHVQTPQNQQHRQQQPQQQNSRHQHQQQPQKQHPPQGRPQHSGRHQ